MLLLLYYFGLLPNLAPLRVEVSRAESYFSTELEKCRSRERERRRRRRNGSNEHNDVRSLAAAAANHAAWEAFACFRFCTVKSRTINENNVVSS